MEFIDAIGVVQTSDGITRITLTRGYDARIERIAEYAITTKNWNSLIEDIISKRKNSAQAE